MTTIISVRRQDRDGLVTRWRVTLASLRAERALQCLTVRMRSLIAAHHDWLDGPGLLLLHLAADDDARIASRHPSLVTELTVFAETVRPKRRSDVEPLHVALVVDPALVPGSLVLEFVDAAQAHAGDSETREFV